MYDTKGKFRGGLMMKHYLLAIGGTGSRVLESVLWAACAGTLCGNDGIPLDRLHMIAIDTDRANTRASRIAELAKHAGHVRQALVSGSAFRTQIDVASWTIELPGTAGTLRSMATTEQDRLLLEALYPAEDANARLTGGLRGHADAGMLLFAGALESAGEPGHPLSSMLWEMQSALETGEEVRVTLCGASFGAVGSAGVCMLARWLRRRFAGAGDQLLLNAVMLTPYEKHPDDDGAESRSRAALENMAISGMVDSAQERGILDALYVLGMPEACRQNAAAHDALLIHWLSACCIADFHTKAADAARGAYYWQTPEETLTWDAFGDRSGMIRARMGRLLRCAALFLCELESSLNEKLQEKAQLKDMLSGWFAANFRSLRHASDDELRAEHKLLQSLTACLRGYVQYLAQLTVGLPLQYRAGGKHMMLVRKAAEHYRQWLQLAGRIYLLEEEIRRSGMEDEYVVTRSASQLTIAEEMLQLTEQKYAELSVLTAQQAVLDRQIGGGSKYRLMKRMLRGIDRALEQDGLRAAENRRILEEASLLEIDEAAEKDLRADSEALYHLESHLDLLRAQRVTLCNEIDSFEKKQMYATAPDIPPEERAEPSCDLFSSAALQQLMDLTKPTEDKRQRAQIVREIEEQYASLVLPEDGDSMRDVLAALGRNQESESEATALGRFIARVLTLSGKEGDA